MPGTLLCQRRISRTYCVTVTVTETACRLSTHQFGLVLARLAHSRVTSNGDLQIDDANPLVKEWALWGVRNLSANGAVKQTIEQLQAQGVASSEALEEAGYEIQLNPATKRPRLVRAKLNE